MSVTKMPTRPKQRLLDSMERLSATIGPGDAGELASLFVSDGRQALARIDRAQRDLNLTAVRRLLSDLRGISSMMSAHELAAACQDPIGLDITHVAAQVADLQQEWNRTEWLLSTWMRVHELQPCWHPGQPSIGA